MRKPRGSDKTLGYIVVPLFLERAGDDNLSRALERSGFSDVADVLNALQEQDEDLIDGLTSGRHGICSFQTPWPCGRCSKFPIARLPQRVALLRTGALPRLGGPVAVAIAQKLAPSVRWDPD